VTVQVTCAFGLMMMGTALLFSLRHLQAVDVGFVRSDVTVFTIANDLGPSKRPQQLQLSRDLEARVAGLNAVDGAGVAWWAVFSNAKRAQRISLPGGSLSAQQAVFYRASPHLLDALRIPLQGGRNLRPTDNDDEPVTSVVNRAFARTYLGRDNPLGLEFVRDDGVRHVVVGVAGDSRYDGLTGGPTPIVYMPMKPPNVFTLYVRSGLAPSVLTALVAREASALGFGFRVRDVTTLAALVDNSIATERLLAAVGVAGALNGLALAIVGLFGALNYTVTDRTAELGLRAALGAQRRHLYRIVMGVAVWPVVAGVLLGGGVAALGIHLIRARLFGVTAGDPAVMMAAVATFLAAALAACAWPAYRAASIAPTEALNQR
jgi:hypothetical protein